MRTSRANLMLERLRVAQLRLAAVALIVMMGVTLLDVTLRYLFNHPVRGSYDLVESMLVIFVFHGISTAFLQRRHIVIDLIDSFAHRAIVAVLIRVSDVLTIATLLLFTYAMVTPALQAFSYGDRKMELGLPLWILWTIALLGMACAILSAVGALWRPLAGSHDDGAIE